MPDRCPSCGSIRIHANPEQADCALRLQLREAGAALGWPRLSVASGQAILAGAEAWSAWIDRAGLALVSTAASMARARLPAAPLQEVVAPPMDQPSVFLPARPRPKRSLDETVSRWPDRRHLLAPHLAEQLRAARLREGIGALRMARRAGISKAMVIGLEQARRAPSVRTVEKLIAALPGLPPQVVAELRLRAIVVENWRQRPDVPWNRRRNKSVLEKGHSQREPWSERQR